MEISVLGKYRTLLIKLDGDIDHHSVSKIREAADRELERTGIVNIAFDFSNVDFMDSSGIGMLIGRYKKTAALNGHIIIFGISGEIRKIIDMSGLGNKIIMSKNLQSALKEAAY